MYGNGATVADRQGNFIIVWSSDGQDGSGLGVYADRFFSPSHVLPQDQPSTRPLRVNTPGALKWRLVGRVAWQESGAMIDVAPGEYLVECQPVQPGDPVPPPIRIFIGAGSGLETRTVDPLSPSAAAGSLVVIIEPESVANSVVREERGQWRFVGETSEAAWRNGGLASLSLASGAYAIEFRQVDGKVGVAARTVIIQAGQASQVRVFYEDESSLSPNATQPAPVADNELAAPPYCFSGQFLTDAGSGSGTVVKPRVVLTAAHVVFDDVTLTYTTGVKWLFQRQRGTAEPAALVPRGSYVFNSYSQVRQVDRIGLGVGQATQRSQQRDAAAVYFTREAGRFGFTDVLATGEATETEWLANLDPATSQPRKKTLVGYPVDLNYLKPQNGYRELDAGRMFRTPMAPVAFTRIAAETLPTGVTESDARLNTNRVYQTTALAGYPGESGGGLWVQYDDGNYYPAGIYVGGTDKSVVRAIDAPVVDLIGRADSSAQSASDQNNTGGGIARVSSLVSNSAFIIAKVQVTFTGLDAADQSKPNWTINGIKSSGSDTRFFSAGTYVMTFAKVAGYREPRPFQISVQNTDDLVVEAQYVKLVAPTITTSALKRAQTGQAYAFQLQSAGGATGYEIASSEIPGLVVNAKGLLTSPSVSAQPGVYSVAVKAKNAQGSMTRTFPLQVVVTGHLEILHRDVSDPLNIHAGTAKIDGIFDTKIVGDPITLTAVPQKGLLFKQWTGFGIDNLPSAQPKLAFIMKPSVILYAEFVHSPFPPRAATYYGGLQEETPQQASTGLAQLTLTAGGRFTGKATVADRTYGFGGKFSVDGTFRGQVARPKAGPKAPAQAPLDLELQFHPGQDDGAIRGTLGGLYDPLSSIRTAVSFTLRRAVSVGGARRVYTLVIPADPTAASDAAKPHGASAASLAVSPSGSVRTTLLLADGASVTVGSSFTGSEPGAAGPFATALFTSLYGDHGSFAAALVLNPTSQKLTGSTRWFRDAEAVQFPLSGPWPDGLSSPARGELFPVPSKVLPILAGFRPLVMQGNDQLDRITFQFDVAKNRVVNGLLGVTGAYGTDDPSPASFTIKIDPKTGLIRGAYQPPVPGTSNFNVQQNFTGAILRSENQAFGASLSMEPTRDAANVTWQLIQSP